MPVLDAVLQYQDKAVLTVVKELWDIGPSLPFYSTYLVADSYGRKYLYPGMIVAPMDADREWWVPYNASGSYGTYSVYPEGILYELYDCTFQTQIVAPATRVAVVTGYCYVFGGTLGDIPDAIRQAIGMKLVQWD